MKKKSLSLLIAIGFFAGVVSETALACTSLIISRSASADESVYITYTCDAEFHPYLDVIPATAPTRDLRCRRPLDSVAFLKRLETRQGRVIRKKPPGRKHNIKQI